MEYFDVHYLQDKAISIVQQFLDSGASLDSLVATQAEADQLNPEQIKRLIEAVNTLAFLKNLQLDKDRTKEFPVASFDGVMAALMPKTDSAAPTEQVKEAALTPQELIKYKTLAKRRKEQRLSQEHEAMLKKAFWQTACEVENLFPEYVDNVAKARGLKKEAQENHALMEAVSRCEVSEGQQAFLGITELTKSASYIKQAQMDQAKAFLSQIDAVNTFHNAYQEKVAFLEECLEKQAGLFSALGAGVSKLIRTPIVAGASKLGKGIMGSMRDAGSVGKNALAAQRFAMKNKMGFNEAVTHLSHPVNRGVAENFGFDAAGYKNEMASLKKTGKKLDRAFLGATAVGAAADMHHNPNTDINTL